MVWTIFENLRVQKNLNIEKIIFKDVQMKFLAMHINNQYLRFDIFMIGISSRDMILISNDFWHKIKMIILSHTVYC